MRGERSRGIGGACAYSTALPPARFAHGSVQACRRAGRTGAAQRGVDASVAQALSADPADVLRGHRFPGVFAAHRSAAGKPAAVPGGGRAPDRAGGAGGAGGCGAADRHAFQLATLASDLAAARHHHAADHPGRGGAGPAPAGLWPGHGDAAGRGAGADRSGAGLRRAGARAGRRRRGPGALRADVRGRAERWPGVPVRVARGGVGAGGRWRALASRWTGAAGWRWTWRGGWARAC